MSVRKRKWRDRETGALKEHWEVHIVFRGAEGRARTVRRKSPVQTKRGAEQFERDVRRALADGTYGKVRKEVPTFTEWFEGRFWEEWVIAEQNKPSEQESKKSVFKCHLKDHFGRLRLDEIAEDGHIPRFKAAMIRKVEAGDLSKKSVNNILAVLSKALRYAEDARVIDRAPRVNLYKLDRPEKERWEFEEYARLLAAARDDDPVWNAAVHLAGEAGLRIGEVRALRWERDIDLVAGTITVNEQTRKGITGTPKGTNRRKVPMTATLLEALKAQPVVRRGYVVRNPDGSQLRDGQTTHAILRICRSAGLPERAWHCLRHTYGTHAAMFGVNPWSLLSWMGHKSITTTMGYIHLAKNHMRPLPEAVLAAAQAEPDPDRRIVQMLSSRRALGEQEQDHGDPAVTTQALKMRKPSAIH